MNVPNLVPLDRSQINSEMEYIIFAANKYPANEVTAYLESKNILVRKCLGRYEGVNENSWIIKASDYHKITDLLDGERTILHLGKIDNIGNRKSAKLIWLIDEGELKAQDELDLGHLTEVSKAVADASEASTIMWENVLGEAPRTIYWICYHYDKFGHPIKD